MYDKLSQEAREIRILFLLSGDVDEDISCKLVTVSLDNLPDYEALSYTWGDPTVKVPIRVNENILQVTANLDNALRHLRRRDEKRALWVDAICINQDDLEEKSYQIPFMGEIYSRTTNCLAWLGLETAYTKQAIATALALGEDKHYYETPLYRVATNEEYVAQMEITNRMTAELYPSLASGWDRLLQLRRDFDAKKGTKQTTSSADPSEIAREYKMVMAFFQCCSDSIIVNEKAIAYPDPASLEVSEAWCSNPYWSRIWILQEINLPRKVTLVWSESSFTMDKLRGTGLWTSRHQRCCLNEGHEYLNPLNSNYLSAKAALARLAESLQRIEQARTIFAAGGSDQHPLSLKHITHGRFCSNPRDYVYGLLGMASYLAPKPDYSAPVRQVYTDATLVVIQRTGKLNILSFARDRFSEYGLPSWASDWSRSNEVNANPDANPTLLVFMNGTHAYRASGDTISDVLPSSMERIGVSGFRFDTVSEVSEVAMGWYDDGDGKTVTEVLGCYGKFLDIPLNTSRPYITGGTLEDAFWRTMVVDRIHEPITSTYRRATTKDVQDLKLWQKQSESPIPHAPEHLKYSLESALRHRCLFRSTNGLIGLARVGVQAGDLLCLFSGADVPYVTREAGNTDTATRLVGEAYVHGRMYGELIIDSKIQAQREWLI
ncbi:hypothetical protein G7Y79_00020g049320 [Physcia stellaris]|nr:hypothetical protein G7Y79_00020g049320 [Physcia stellaris]